MIDLALRMGKKRIVHIANIAGVSYAYAYSWIVDPQGYHQQAYHAVSKAEHDEWVAVAQDHHIALKIQGGLGTSGQLPVEYDSTQRSSVRHSHAS